MRKSDTPFLAGLAAVVAILFLPAALRGRTFFWGDLTYIHHPWRTLAAEMIQRGEPPLWNPYAYLGMPLAAQMQCAAWYPGTLPFYLLPFGLALMLYDAVHFCLAGAFTFLWLRRTGLPRSACAGAAAVYMLGGGLVSRIPFPNHVSTLAYFPALLLAARSPLLFVLTAALEFFSGYPPMLAGEIPAAWILPRILEPKPGESSSFSRWVAAGALCLGLTACLLFPAARLALDSRRSGGIEQDEALQWSFAPEDLIQFTAPPLIRLLGKTAGPNEIPTYSPTLSWWKTSYLGFIGCIMVLGGARTWRPIGVWIYLGGVLLLILGATNPLSRWVWIHVWPLHYVRYPGNMAYLAAPVVAWTAGQGLRRSHRRWRPGPIVLLMTGELLFYALGSQPTVPKSYFAEPGPLVRTLRIELGSHRYLISPRALGWHRGVGPDEQRAFEDFKHRLYGVTNMPYHLPAAANFGEPLVPRRTYDFMDFLYLRPGLADLGPYLGWVDIRILLTKDLFPPAGFVYLGDSLWHIYRAPGPAARAFWFDEKAGSGIPSGLDWAVPRLSRGVPLEKEELREDRFRISGSFRRPGWLYVSEPREDGWRVFIGGKAVPTEQALGAFYKMRVPSGAWTAIFRYDPASWRWGLAMTVFSLCGLAAYGCGLLGRLLRVAP